MKKPAYSRKGQYAVPVILIGTVFMILVYLILAYPEERARIFESEQYFEDEEEITDSPLGGNTQLIFSSGGAFEVGRAIGQTVFTWDNFNDVSVEYPAVPKTLDFVEDVTMRSSLFSSDIQQFSANNLNLDNTKDVVVHMVVSEVKGDPRIVILLNETRIYEKTAAAGEYNVRIQPALLDETMNPLFVRVEGGGLSFSSKSVTFDEISVDQYYYEPANAAATPQMLTISENNYKGSMVHMRFNVTDSVTDGDLMIKLGQPGLQKKIAWSGAPEANQTIIASFPLENNIVIGNNEIQFEAEEEGAYDVDDISIKFIAEAAPPASKVYSFDVPREDLVESERLVLGIKVDRIIEPGYLFFKIAPSQTSYYFPGEDLAAGAWSYVTIDKSKMKELGNKITVDSVNGRFRVSGFVIIADYE